ncbi:hypothetical protein [Castellaniella sp.]|uniref:hypothetical protein n=1 Tax=Castellaniella sp. TaxID=1955812 RepID=UPI003A8E51EB
MNTRYPPIQWDHLKHSAAALFAGLLLTTTPLVGYCSNPDMSSLSELPPTELNASSLHADTYQKGVLNNSHITQKGASAAATVTQEGIKNQASISQTGVNNTAVLAQYGADNDAWIMQGGSNNSGDITQQGTGNRAKLEQYTSNAHASLGQFGNFNQLAVTQTIPGSLPPIIQIGTGLKLNVIR